MPGSGEEVRRVRVLVVEDETDIRESVVELLEAYGFEVSAAEHGRAALDLLRAAATLPDVILLDLMMPMMSGEQFRTEQVADPTLGHVPVVLMSAKRDVAEIGARLRTSGTLEKPVSIDRLVACLRQAVG